MIIHRITDTGETVFKHSGLAVGSDAKFVFHYADWKGTGSATGRTALASVQYVVSPLRATGGVLDPLSMQPEIARHVPRRFAPASPWRSAVGAPAGQSV